MGGWLYPVHNERWSDLLETEDIPDEQKKVLHMTCWIIETRNSRSTAQNDGVLYKRNVSELYTNYTCVARKFLEIQEPDFKIIEDALTEILGELCRMKLDVKDRGWLYPVHDKSWSKLLEREDIPDALEKVLHMACWIIETRNSWSTAQKNGVLYERKVSELYTNYKCDARKFLEIQEPDFNLIEDALTEILQELCRMKLDVKDRVRIRVKSFDERRHDFYINQNDTARAFKSQVSAKAGIPEYEFALMYNETELTGNEALSVFGIRNGSTLKIVPNARQERIYVKSLNGSKHEFNGINRSDTVQAFKSKVSERLSIQENEFILVYNRYELKDNEVLSAVGIHNYSTIMILLNGDKDVYRTLFAEVWNNAINAVEMFSSLPDPTRKVTELGIAQIAEAIGKGWELLGYHLGLKRVEIEQISEDNTKVLTKVMGLLWKWSDKNQAEATVGELHHALKKCGCNVTIEWTEVGQILAGM